MGALSGAKVFFFISACLFSLCWGQDLSRKAKKWQDSDDDTWNAIGVAETTTEDTDDGWGDDDDDDFWGDDGGWGDDDDDPWGESSGSLLPPCESLFSDEAIPGENCDNTTIVPPEIRLNDPIYERLIAQVWSDFQYKLNQEAQLYGVQLDPFDVDAKLPEPIDLQQQGTGYSADVQMHGIKMYGLSGIYLEKVEVTRSENLTDMRINVVFGFNHLPSLEINGTYALKGWVGWTELDSNGEQPFSIKMVNATLNAVMHMDLIKAEDLKARRCTPTEDSPMTQMDNVLIEEIQIKLGYDDIDFSFENLGNFANNMINLIGVGALQTQEGNIVGQIRKAIKENVNSLIC